MSQFANKPSALLVVSDNFAKQLMDRYIFSIQFVRVAFSRDCYWRYRHRAFFICDRPAPSTNRAIDKNTLQRIAQKYQRFGKLDNAESHLLYQAGVSLLREPDGTAEIAAAILPGNVYADASHQESVRGQLPVESNERKCAMAGSAATRSPWHRAVVALTRNEVRCLALADSSNEPTNREALTRVFMDALTIG